MGEIVLRDADAIVGHGENYIFSVRIECYANLTAFFNRFNGVRKQIAKNLGKEPFVGLQTDSRIYSANESSVFLNDTWLKTVYNALGKR